MSLFRDLEYIHRHLSQEDPSKRFICFVTRDSRFAQEKFQLVCEIAKIFYFLIVILKHYEA